MSMIQTFQRYWNYSLVCQNEGLQILVANNPHLFFQFGGFLLKTLMHFSLEITLKITLHWASSANYSLKTCVFFHTFQIPLFFHFKCKGSYILNTYLFFTSASRFLLFSTKYFFLIMAAAVSNGGAAMAAVEDGDRGRNNNNVSFCKCWKKKKTIYICILFKSKFYQQLLFQVAKKKSQMKILCKKKVGFDESHVDLLPSSAEKVRPKF